ncbi:MAG: CYTH domain-containing protein [Clostridiales bacterium]|nr:CYTH domain-containing protein [Clostridiales bacterium]
MADFWLSWRILKESPLRNKKIADSAKISPEERRNMEIELKYNIPGKERADEIWADPELEKFFEEGSRQTNLMKAVYFDTADHRLGKEDIAFRVRLKGASCVATLKWRGSSSEGLHIREEINVPVAGETCMIQPTADIFRESEQGKKVAEIVGDAPLESIFEMHFLRHTARIDIDDAIFELAVDVGETVGDKGSVPICELELELFSGDQDAMIRFGAQLAEKYGLTPENGSKYSRALSVVSLPESLTL